VNSLFTRFTAFDTSAAPSSQAKTEHKPDVTIYEKKEVPPTHTITSFQKMEMFVEFNHDNSFNPFATKGNFFPKIFDNDCADRDQISLYAAQQQAHQFRTSILTVGIFGKIARLFRWDRAGCKVTVPIDYSTEKGNSQLTEFFLRFDRMADDPEARGWDPTVKEATTKEVEDFAKAVKVACEGRPKSERRKTCRQKEVEGEEKAPDPIFCKLVQSVGDPGWYPRKRVSVLDGEDTRNYIVGRSISDPKDATGRATRGFVAMSVETKKLVFLKDSWRIDVEDIRPEGHWYQVLVKKRCRGAKYIGAYSHGSDVYATKKIVRCQDEKQRTITHLYAKDRGRVEAMMGYIHYRVVQPELYLPLKSFRDSKHLTNIMYDVAQGPSFQFIHRFIGIDFVYRP
jgi:hypothetical protein